MAIIKKYIIFYEHCTLFDVAYFSNSLLSQKSQILYLAHIMSSEQAPSCVTCISSINIALVKYWGKQNTVEGKQLHLPLHDSLSITLSHAHIHTVTTVSILHDTDTTSHTDPSSESASPGVLQLSENSPSSLNNIRFIFNDVETSPLPERISSVLSHLRNSMAHPSLPPLEIRTKNNFPTGAGMASSASGSAALAGALKTLFPTSEVNLSALARIGSGSACRSTLGGFVRWDASAQGLENCVSQIAGEHDWPDLNILGLVISQDRKGSGSTQGMQHSVNTSRLIKDREQLIVPQRMRKLCAAIEQRDFSTLAAITMAESDDLHALCHTSCPPLHYLLPESYAVMRLIRSYNQFKQSQCRESRDAQSQQTRHKQQVFAAYTFDAGPNPFLLCESVNLVEILFLLLCYFGDLSDERILIDPSCSVLALTELSFSSLKKTDIATETSVEKHLRNILDPTVVKKLENIVNDVKDSSEAFLEPSPLLYLYHFLPGSSPFIKL